MKVFMVVMVVSFATVSEARVSPPLSLKKLAEKVAGGLKRAVMRDSVTGGDKRKGRWFAHIAIPAFLLASGLQAEEAGVVSNQFFQQQTLARVWDDEQVVRYSRAGDAQYGDSDHDLPWMFHKITEQQHRDVAYRDLAWVSFYFGEGTSLAPHTEQFRGAHYPEIHGSGNAYERAGHTSAFGIGVGDSSPAFEAKIIWFDSTAGAATNDTIGRDIEILGLTDPTRDWIAAVTFQAVGLRRDGLVFGPSKYAPLSISVGAGMREFVHYTYSPHVWKAGQTDGFLRSRKRDHVPVGVLQADLDLLDFGGGNILGVSYIGTFSSIPTNENKEHGFTHLFTITGRISNQIFRIF